MKRARQRTRRRDRHQQAIRQVSTAALQQEPQQQPDQAPPIHPILHMQRTVGNRRTQAHIQRITDEEKADLQAALTGLETMLGHAGTEATVDRSVPAQYRETIQGVNKAQSLHQDDDTDINSTDWDDARRTVEERYAELGLMGELILALNGSDLTLREQVKRQTNAFNVWREVYPDIQDLLSDCEKAGITVQPATRRSLDRWHKAIVNRLPQLTTRLGPLPEGVEIMESYFDAKKLVEKLEYTMETASKDLDALDKLYKVRDAQMKMDGIDPKVAEVGAVAALKWLKTVTSTPKAWTDALKNFEEGHTLKGTIGIAALSKDLVEGSVGPILKLQVMATELRLQDYATTRWPDKVAEVGYEAALEGTDELAALTKMKRTLDVFDKVTGTIGSVLDITSGIIDISDGIKHNKFESLVGGSLSLAQGAIGAVDLVAGSSFGAVLGPWFVCATALTMVTAEWAKMVNGFKMARWKHDLEVITHHAQETGKATKTFMMGAQQYEALSQQESGNVVDQALVQSYQNLARKNARLMILNSEYFVRALLKGSLGQHEVIRQAFDQGVGGMGEGAVIAEKLASFVTQLEDGAAPETLIRIGQEMGDEVPGMLRGVQYVAQTLQGADADIQSVPIWGPDQDYDSLELKAYWSQKDDTLYWYPGFFKVEGPLNDPTYKQTVYDRHAGKAIGDIRGIPIHINVDIELEKAGGAGLRLVELEFIDGQFKDVLGARLDPADNDLVQPTGNRLKESTLPTDVTLSKD